MNGNTVVFIVFAIVLASMFGYMFLLSRRQRELEIDVEELRGSLKNV